MFRLMINQHQSFLNCEQQVGGATGRVGDPSGRSTERPLLDLDIIQNNIVGLKSNIDACLRPSLTILVDNYDWYKGEAVQIHAQSLHF